MKQGSNQGLRFMWFNEYKRRVTSDGEIPLTPIMGLFGGMSAGCFSTLGNNPFDVVKVSLNTVVLCWFVSKPFCIDSNLCCCFALLLSTTTNHYNDGYETG